MRHPSDAILPARDFRPTAMLVGPGRTGTTSLFEWLAQQPGIGTSRHKETQVFRPAILRQPIDLARYETEFATSESPWRIEASPSYFQGGEALAKAIREVCGRIPIIVTLREPTDRLLSNFHHIRDKHLFDGSYSFSSYSNDVIRVHNEGIQAADDFPFTGLIESDYGAILRDWISVFGGDRVLVCFYENFRGDLAGTLGTILRHVGIAGAHVSAATFPATNVSRPLRSLTAHRAAMALAASAEPFFGRYPRIKRHLQTAYYRLNSGRGAGAPPVRTEAEDLVDRYCSTLSELPDCLSQCAVAGPIPEWVCNRSR